ncbi:UGT80B1 [Symbiodinium sp. CCMP2456]|nr:UGT80B1 [Symbiodinium sp. CCMP2456]
MAPASFCLGHGFQVAKMMWSRKPGHFWTLADSVKGSGAFCTSLGLFQSPGEDDICHFAKSDVPRTRRIPSLRRLRLGAPLLRSTPLVQMVLPQAGARLTAACGRRGVGKERNRCHGYGERSQVAGFRNRGGRGMLPVETLVTCLGRNVLEKLRDLVPPLLDLALTRRQEAKQDAACAALDLASERLVLRALGALCRSLGPFLSPFLDRFLEVSCRGPKAGGPAVLQELAGELVKGVPHRLLLASVQAATVDPFDSADSVPLDEKLLHMQRLASFHIWILSKASPEFVAGISDAIMASLLRLLAVSSGAIAAFLQAGTEAAVLAARVSRQPSCPAVELSWEQFGSQPSIWQLHQLAAAAFAHFVLRLELEEMKKHFVKVLEWARDKQPKLLDQQRLRKAKDFEGIDPASDAIAACRVMAGGQESLGVRSNLLLDGRKAVTATMSCVADAAPGTAEELLPLGTKEPDDLSTALVACRRFAQLGFSKLQRALARLAWTSQASDWAEGAEASEDWREGGYRVQGGAAGAHVVVARRGSAVTVIATASFQTPATPRPPEELRDPVANLLDIFEFLAQDSSATTSLRSALEAALVALTNVASESGVKLQMQVILEKSRSEDAEVRLNAVKCVHRIWMDLGVQVVMCLSEVTMYASELLEDEDSRVEMAVRAMIKTMEASGEQKRVLGLQCHAGTVMKSIFGLGRTARARACRTP